MEENEQLLVVLLYSQLSQLLDLPAGHVQSVLEMITKLFDQACNFSPLDILLLLLLSKLETLLEY